MSSDADFVESVLRDLEKLDAACLAFLDADGAKPRDLKEVLKEARRVDACKAELLDHDLLRLDGLAMGILQSSPGDWGSRFREELAGVHASNIDQLHRLVRRRHPSLLNLAKLLRRQQQAAKSLCLNPPPATVDAFLSECEKHRVRIMAAMKEGRPFLPGTDANFAALVKEEKNGFLLPPFSRLFDAAVALDLGDVPAFPGEPQTGRDAVAALDTLIAWCKAKQNPASNSAGTAQTIKEPSKDAIACYRLSLVNGGSQSELAAILSRELGRTISQPQVSRWLKQVNAWRKAGNILPDVPADNGPRPKTVRMDPAKIDRGDGRKSTTWPPRRSDDNDSDDADRKAELQRLIAEQQGEDDYDFEPIQDDD